MIQIDLLRTEAQKAKDDGNIRLAAHYLAEIRRLVPDDYGVLRELVVATADYDIVSAVSLLESELLRTSDAASRMALLELQLPYAEDLERRKRGLNGYSALDPDEPEFQYVEEKLAEFRQLCDGTGLPFFQARSAFLQRDLEACDRFLDRRGRETVDARDGSARFTGSWFDDIELCADAALSHLPPVSGLYPADSATKRIFIGCDWSFYTKYGRSLRSSFEQSGTKNCELYVHLYDPPDDVSGGTRAEMTGLSDKPQTAPLYYACMRIVRFYELMVAHPKPTVMVDADLFVGRPLNDLFAMLADADVAACRMPGRIHYHTQFNASVFGIAPTEAGMRFLRRAAGFTAKTFRSGRAPWCLDQLSILCTLRNLQLLGRGPKARAVGPGIYDGAYDAALWPQKVPKHSPLYAHWEAAAEKFRSG